MYRLSIIHHISATRHMIKYYHYIILGPSYLTNVSWEGVAIANILTGNLHSGRMAISLET